MNDWFRLVINGSNFQMFYLCRDFNICGFVTLGACGAGLTAVCACL
jgi:hypothetical protein